MRTLKITSILGAALLCAATSGQAVPLAGGAPAHGHAGAVGTDSSDPLAGSSFSDGAAATDAWNAGTPPGWSNAGGLGGDRSGVGSTPPGHAFGTLKTHGQDLGPGGEGASIGAPVTTAVPEPQTYAMLLAGMIAVGIVARRRRR